VFGSHLQRSCNGSFSISSTDLVHEAPSESLGRREAVGSEHDSAQSRRRQALLENCGHSFREWGAEIKFVLSTVKRDQPRPGEVQDSAKLTMQVQARSACARGRKSLAEDGCSGIVTHPDDPPISAQRQAEASSESMTVYSGHGVHREGQNPLHQGIVEVL
jgi:hypothetical protein